jgi:hypothetical protein
LGVDAPFQRDSFGLDVAGRRAFSLGFEGGRGPALGGDQYARIIENPFRAISAATDNA